MNSFSNCVISGLSLILFVVAVNRIQAEESPKFPRAWLDGNGTDWEELREESFVNVNCNDNTWNWKNGVAHCSGNPTGVIRTKEQFTNFELVLQWRHLRSAGNSGVFVWVSEESVQDLEQNKYPSGIEIQALDHAFTDEYVESSGKKPDWFTTNGDVFPVGNANMTPFPPVSPDGKRSFPSRNLSRGVGQWNHYYIRCIQGEVRLWVNGEEVSGGTNCSPSTGYVCLESEGSPLEFKNIHLRKLP